MSKGASTRREFTKQLAALAAVPLLGAPAAEAGEPRPGRGAAEALADLARAKYGQHLTAEQLQQVQEKIENNLRAAEALRRVPLQNGDEPDFGFSPDVP